jgi:hypothetical protein
MSAPIDLRSFGWWHRQGIIAFSYTCGHCGNVVSSEKGYKLGQYQDGSGTQVAALYICLLMFRKTLPDSMRKPGSARVPVAIPPAS